jgi:aspartyl/glutamyl-tRNA(Asn/Gln) amidotransferase C subunit
MILYQPYYYNAFTMSLSTADVQKVARLARLAMNDTEIEAARAQMSGIFELIAQMQAVDTAGIEPMSHAQDLSQRVKTASPKAISANCSSRSHRKSNPACTSYLKLSNREQGEARIGNEKSEGGRVTAVQRYFPLLVTLPCSKITLFTLTLK